MKKISFSLNNALRIKPFLKCNGKLVQLKREANVLRGVAQVQEDSATIEIFNYYPLSNRLWFLYAFIFWALGLILFAPRWEKHCPSIKSTFVLPLTGDVDLGINFYPFYDGKRAYELSGCSLSASTISSNQYFIDKKAQKRAKLVRILSFLSVFVVGAAIALIITAIQN